jgi:actin-like ATPase involved in cell morphogenesis
LTTNEIVDAMQPPLEEIVATIRRVLEKTPPRIDLRHHRPVSPSAGVHIVDERA